MANLTKEQVNSILDNAPQGASKTEILDGLVKRGHTLEGVKMQDARVRISGIEAQQAQQGNQFEEAPPEGFFAKARNMATAIIGGGSLAKGAGQALSTSDSGFAKGVRGTTSFLKGEGFNTTGVQENMSEAIDQAVKIEGKLMQEIKKNKASGMDTTRLEGALAQLRQSMDVTNDAQQDFVDNLVTDKEIIGSALRLAGTFAGGKIGGAVASKVGGAGTGVVGGAIQGAKIGAGSGVIEGAIQGAGMGLEANKDAMGVAKSALGGATVGGVAGGVLGGAIGAGTGALKARTEAKAHIKNLIESAPEDSRVAQYKLAGDKVVKDKVGQEAVKQGFDEGAVSVMKGSSPADKTVIKGMVDDLKKGMTDRKYAMANHPSRHLGKSGLERLKVNTQLNKEAGKQLGQVANTLKGQPVDIDKAVMNLVDELGDTGVTFKNGQPVFDGADFAEIKSSENLIKRVIKRSSGVDMQDAYQVHKLKQFIRDQLSNAKFEGTQGNVERIVTDFASAIDDSLDTTFPSYNKVNTQFSATREATDDLYAIIGKKFDPTKPNADSVLATYLRRLDNNTVSSGKLTDALNKLDEVGTTYGHKFNDDIATQAIALQEIESVFPSAIKRNSFQGQITQGVEKAKGIAGALKRSQGLGDLALEAGGTAIEKAKGVNEQNALKALEALLSEADEIPPTSFNGVADPKTAGLAGAVSSRMSGLKQFTPDMVDDIQTNVLSRKTLDESGSWVSNPKQKAVIIDADLVKKRHPRYNPDKPQELHKESSLINSEMFREAVDLDESGIVKMTSGGAGSGKSEVIVDNIMDTPAVILDGTLKDPTKSIKDIDYALKAGKKVEIHAVYPRVKLAYMFNQLRSRSVPDAPFIDTHAGQRKSLPELFNKYGENPNVEWKLYSNNRFGQQGSQFTPKNIREALVAQSQVDVIAEVEQAKKALATMTKTNIARKGAELTASR